MHHGNELVPQSTSYIAFDADMPAIEALERMKQGDIVIHYSLIYDRIEKKVFLENTQVLYLQLLQTLNEHSSDVKLRFFALAIQPAKVTDLESILPPYIDTLNVTFNNKTVGVLKNPLRKWGHIFYSFASIVYRWIGLKKRYESLNYRVAEKYLSSLYNIDTLQELNSRVFQMFYIRFDIPGKIEIELIKPGESTGEKDVLGEEQSLEKMVKDSLIKVDDAGQPVIIGPAGAGKTVFIRRFDFVKEDEDGEDETVKPYHLNVNYDKEILLNEKLDVLVSIDKDALEADNTAINIPDGRTVQIFVHSNKGFRRVGDTKLTLMIPADIGKKLLFQLNPLEIGTGEFHVYAMLDSKEIGSMRLEVEVRAPATVKEEPPRTVPVNIQQPIELIPASTEPDLLIQILASVPGEELQFFITAQDPEIDCKARPFGPVPLAIDPFNYFHEFFKKIDELEIDTDEKAHIAVEQMKKKGGDLYTSLLPGDLRELIWAFRDKITTVLINSNEPWVPWEMCFLSGLHNRSVVSDQFLCERFDITRWIPGGHSPSLINVSKAAFIVPEHSGLEYSEKERRALVELFKAQGKETRNIDARYLAIDQALKSGHFSVIHFSGHGNAGDTPSPLSSRILLNDEQFYKPEDISGEVLNLRKARPLVFLNACQGGKMNMNITGLGGWAEKFLSASASVFIGAYWSVGDEHAYKFAVEFYTRLFEGKTVARATREARLVLRESGDPTWLAYTVFANPHAKLTTTVLNCENNQQ